MDFIDILKAHYAKYPLMCPDDMVKLAYQNEFGCGHMIRSEEESLKSIINEFASHKRGFYKAEDIGGGYCRLDLSVCEGIDPVYLNKMFVYSANNSRGSDEAFLVKKAEAKEFAYSVFDGQTVDCFFNDYEKTGGISPCHHSREYFNAYKPSYRVVLSAFGAYFDVFERIAELLKKKKNPVISLDGPAASGKTYLSGLISAVFGVNIVHTDDFFLPAQRRTDERMQEPGGNVDYERFVSEVAIPLKKCDNISYGVFSCKTQSVIGKKRISACKPVLIEGSYSNHEKFGDIYDLRIFLDTPEEIRNGRLSERETEESLEKFVKIWLPAEEKYFNGMKIREKCDMVIDGRIDI